MNIQQIKATIATCTEAEVLTLDMARQMDDVKDAATGAITKVPTEWYTYWDNTNRRRITMHEDVFVALKGDKTIEGLALKSYEGKQFKVVTPAGKAPYTLFVITKPTSIEASF